MTTLIKAAAEQTLKVANIKATIVVTPSTISIEGMKDENEAKTLEIAFVKAGMKSLGFCNMAEIGMGEGFDLTIAY